MREWVFKREVDGAAFAAQFDAFVRDLRYLTLWEKASMRSETRDGDLVIILPDPVPLGDEPAKTLWPERWAAMEAIPNGRARRRRKNQLRRRAAAFQADHQARAPE
jgi:hypothetical protein